MDQVTAVFAVLAALNAAAAASLYAKLKSARAALRELENRGPAPAPPRVVESRRERYGLLWFTTLTVDDRSRLVTAASAGLPHCARCVRPLALVSAVPEEWACEGCGEKRPGTAADLAVVDSVVAESLREFLARHAGYRAAPSLSPRRGAPAPA